jgi:hypothetical protein
MESVADFRHPDEIERLHTLRGERAPKFVEFRVLRKDGSTAWLEARPTVVELLDEGHLAAEGVGLTLQTARRFQVMTVFFASGSNHSKGAPSPSHRCAMGPSLSRQGRGEKRCRIS